MRPLLVEHGAPGVAVATTADGETRVYNFGLASKADKRPVADDTLFEIGSLSKTFTATLAAYAEALGKLSLEARPSAYAPEFAGSDLDKATLLELGTYAAGGLPLQFPDGVGSNAEALSYLRAWKAAAPPGTERRYSNPSIGLLGHLTERAKGRDFAELLEQELFAGLGLRSTWLRVPAGDAARYAWGHDKAGAQIRVRPGPFDAEAYGVKSTAADMIRFVEANLRPEDGAIGRAIKATHVPRYRAGAMTQGLGWEQLAFPVSLDRLLAANATTLIFDATPVSPVPATAAGPTMFGKTGSTAGFGAYVAFVPAAGVGVVILANRNVPVPARLEAAHAILEALAAGRR